MRFKRLEHITDEDIVAMMVVGPQGQILLKPGAKITERAKARLRELSFTGVCVHDDKYRDINYEPIINMETRIAALNAVKELDVEECLFIAEKITTDIIDGDGVVKSSLETLGNYDTSVISHSLSVALYAGTLAVRLGYTPMEIRQVIEASLLHDIGKSKIPPEILNKEGPLTEEEFEVVKTHASLGYEMLKDYTSVAATVKSAVHSHHENYNGTGYPMGFAGDKIYKYAQIIRICDVYDAMISERCYKRRQSPSVVLEYLDTNRGGTL